MKQIIHITSIAFIFFLFGFLDLQAQEKGVLDSLAKLLQNPKEDSAKVDILNDLANRYKNINITKSDKYVKEALALALKLRYAKGESEAYQNIGDIFLRQNKIKNAIDNYISALKISESSNKYTTTIEIYCSISYAYILQKRFKEAERNLNIALEIQEKYAQKDESHLLVLSNFAILYGETKNLEKEMETNIEALKITQKLKNELNEAIILNNIGEGYIDLKQYDKALDYFEQSEKISLKINDQEGLMVLMVNRAKVFYAQNKLIDAETKCLQAIKLGEEVNIELYLNDAYKLMANINEDKGDFKTSLAYYKKYEEIKDRLYEDENNDKLNQIQELYEIEKKEKEITQQKMLQKEQANVIKRQNLAFSIVLISLIIVLVLTLLLYIANNQKKHSNKRLKEINQVKDRLFSIIAHDLKSPLDSLQGTISLLNDNNLNDDELKFLVKGLSEKLNDTQNLLNNLLNWAKTQMKGIEVHPQTLYLTLLVNEQFKIFSSVAHKKNITLQSNVNESIEVFADLEMLKVILRNLISNAIKFTPQFGNISIESIENKDENFCTISVKDTGVGILPEILPIIFEMKTYYSEQGTAQEKGTGLGLILAKDFVKRNKGKLWVESQKDKGTTFYFTLPIKD